MNQSGEPHLIFDARRCYQQFGEGDRAREHRYRFR